VNPNKLIKNKRIKILGRIPTTTRKGTVSVPARIMRLDRTQRHTVLATASGNRPHASLVAFALTPDYHGLLFATPKATTKYRNMIKNSRVSLVIDNRENSKEDYLGAEAITIFGRARQVRQARTEMAAILTRKHPALKEFFDASTTALMLVKFERCLHVGRFQTVTEWRG
jgi:nitroimidazol reductase NimA-like FMN-containing flavoprotein (pyridoxamine 5'-phosphate oxidase superfamily)